MHIHKVHKQTPLQIGRQWLYWPQSSSVSRFVVLFPIMPIFLHTQGLHPEQGKLSGDKAKAVSLCTVHNCGDMIAYCLSYQPFCWVDVLEVWTG